MERKQSLRELFLEAKNHFKTILKDGYLKSVEESDDKDYAQDFYKRVYFSENEQIPFYSVLFDEMRFTFDHFYKLKSADAIDNTLKLLPKIREIGASASGRATSVYKSEVKPVWELHSLHREAIEMRGIDLSQLILLERKVHKSTDEDLVKLLAYYQATKELIAEFGVPEIQSTPTGSIDFVSGNILTRNRSGLTRSQQVLVFYYACQLLSVKYDKNVSNLTSALYLLLGLPEPRQITHSDLYKKMLHPITSSSDEASVQNLKIIRPIFEKIGLQKALDLIDQDIEKLGGDHPYIPR